MVKVLLFGHALRHAVGENEIDVELAQPTTVKKFIELNHGQLGAVEPFMTNREVLVTINKKVSTEDSLIKDGDVVKMTHHSKTSYDGVRDIPT
jgi:molybdopterin synthase sulfur carrier subunit